MKVLLVVLCVLAASVSSYKKQFKVDSFNKLSTLADKYDQSKWAKLSTHGPLLLDNVGDIWTDCSKASDPFKIDSVKITPDPPKKGSNITINATVTLSEEITGGKITIKLKWGFITVVNESMDLCEAVKQAGKSCPLEKGDMSFSANAAIPGIAPSGHYTGNVQATDQNGKELVCADLDFHM